MAQKGKSLIDRYLAMNATPVTNPPNIRSRRKFFSGNVWEKIERDKPKILDEEKRRINKLETPF